MRKRELAHRLAQDAHLTPGEAADQLDKLTHDVLKKIRRGQPAVLPGLGKFLPGGQTNFQFLDKPAKPAPKPRRRS